MMGKVAYSVRARNVAGAANPHISLRKDGPFYRVQPIPADALPPSIRQPETHVGHLSATMAARVLSEASGLPIIDHTIKAPVS